MAVERNANSVLAKLMGIQRTALPVKFHGRRSVLSENYLQNIALLTYRERAPLDFYEYDDESTMAVEGQLQSEDVIQLSEGTSVNKCHDFRLEMENGCRLHPKGIVELNMQKSKSHLPRRSFSLPNSPSSGKKQSISSRVKSKGTSSQNMRKQSLNNGIESRKRDLTSQQVAKQVSSQVKDSIWHRFAEISEAEPRSDKSSANEMASSPGNEHTSSSTKAIMKSASQEAKKTNKALSERQRTRKSAPESRIFCGNSDGVNCRTPSAAGKVNAWQVGAARYLSMPTLFPSAWVPRSRTRDLNLDRNWCLRPEKRDSLRCDNSGEEVFSHEALRSKLKLTCLSLSCGEYDNKKEASTLSTDLEHLEESNVLEEISSVPESFIEGSPFSDVESPTYHDALMTMSETGDTHLENLAFESELNFSVPPSIDNEEIVDEGIEKLGTCIKLQREQLSSEASMCIVLEDRGPSFPEFCLKRQVKVKAYEPGSPVSSLEGPEGCRCRPKSIAETNQISSLPNFLDNNIHGLQATLQPMDTMSIESGSEGPEMLVSSDGDNEGGSVDCYREDPQIMRLYSTSENRDFSYLVDVLSESGFPMLNMEMEREAWCSHGYVLNPSVFDLLEKKYGKQTFWERSERKLLFDRMDSGLTEIVRSLDPLNTQRKPLAKRLCPTQNQEFIEEELWGLLVKQEEESKQVSSSKVCGREVEWLEVEAYTYMIVKEVESLLLEELVEEFVSMATFF